MKKIFENAVWWSGVIMVGLIIGVSLQFVRAWTEPAVAPPGGNVGAPINTSALYQIKAGILGVAGLVTNAFQLPNGALPGYVLTAQPDLVNPAISNGQAAWAPRDAGVVACTHKRSNVIGGDGSASRGYVLYCPTDYPFIVDCHNAWNEAGAASPSTTIHSTNNCTTDGYCDPNTYTSYPSNYRGSLMYEIVKPAGNSSEGCWAYYDGAIGTRASRLEITCCKS